MAIIFLENKLQERKDKKMQNLYQSDKLCAMTDIELTERFRNAVKIENKIKEIKGIPIACYDKERKEPYLEFMNGRREYIEKAGDHYVCRP